MVSGMADRSSTSSLLHRLRLEHRHEFPPWVFPKVYFSPRVVRNVLFHLLGREPYDAHNENRERPLIYDLMRYTGSRIGTGHLSFVLISIIPSFLSELRRSWLKIQFGGDFTTTPSQYKRAVIRALIAAILSETALELLVHLLQWMKSKHATFCAVERAKRSDAFALILGSICAWFAAKITRIVESYIFRFALRRVASKIIRGKELNHRYERLDSRNIRLLEIRRLKLWGRKNNFRLITVSLENLPKYHAISYTWDSQPRDHLIDIDEQTLPVTENVAIILGALSSFWTSKLLWIDQICINQQDMEEKTIQVQLMWEIYSKASSMIVWLSPFISNSMADDSPLEWSIYNTRSEKSLYDRGSQSTHSLKEQGTTEQLALYPPKELVQFILSHQFWWRLWIVQEIALAQNLTVICVNRQINWNQLCKFVRKNKAFAYETLVHPTEHNDPESYGTSPTLPLSVRSLQGIRQIFMLTEIREMVQSRGASRDSILVEDSSSAWGLLNKTASSMCSDERDKLFGLFGILKMMVVKNQCTNDANPQQDRHKDDALYRSFIPNYSKSAHKIFLQATRAYIGRSGEVDPLRWAGRGWNRNIKSLPTWITDWSLIPETLIHGFESYPGSLQVGGLSHWPEAAYSMAGRFLQVNGVLEIGRIVTLTSSINHDCSFSNKRPRFIRKWLYEAVEMLANAPRSFHESHGIYRVECFDSKRECRDEVLWRTLVADMYVGMTDPADLYIQSGVLYSSIRRQEMAQLLSKPRNKLMYVDCQRPAPKELGESFVVWSTFPDKCQTAEATDKPISPKAVTHATRFSMASRPHTQGRRLALIESGHLCLVPPLAQIGDIVCAFEHIRIPYLIRETDKSTRQQPQLEKPVFELVGQCYTHGLMHGERSILKDSDWERRRPILLK